MNGAIAAQKAIWPKVEKPYASANVAYPTDSGLLAKGVVALVGLVAVIKLAGLARRTRLRDRRRSVRRRAHEVAVWLRRRNDDAKEEVLAITGQLAALAEVTVAEARQVAVNARRALARGDRRVSGRALRGHALAIKTQVSAFSASQTHVLIRAGPTLEWRARGA